jgi:hypothetical protein
MIPGKNCLNGGRTYSVALPGPVPAKVFWSFMVYDGQTRSMLETDQKTAGIDSLNPNVKPKNSPTISVGLHISYFHLNSR